MMFLHKSLKNPFPILGLCIFITLIFFYAISYFKVEPPSPRSNHLRNLNDELLTQDPIHLAKQREYENQLLSRIKNAAHKKVSEIKKMNHDPMGVLVHNYKGDQTGNLVGVSHMVNSYKGKVIGRDSSGHRIIHFDLKGAPPKIEYLKSLLPLLRSLGATGILMEYEDMFPYWGNIENIRALNAYKKEDIISFVKEASKNGLEVIPLIQTLGHMEFILKLQEYSQLREVPNYPQAICPTNNNTLPLINQLIDQIMEIHPGINWLHIGLDEVFNLGECTRCQMYLDKEEIHKNDLFLRHAVHVAKYIKQSFDVQPIMWDDQLRKIPIQSILKSEIGKFTEIMIWKYSPGILANIGNDIWEKYSEAFHGIWVAGAFKGAAMPDSFLTDINDRLSNNKEWVDVLDLYKANIPFKGIVLTGWQRFDHFAVLCELLPQAIPSLAITLSYLLNKKADHNALSSVGKQLGCDSFLNMDLKYIEFVNHCNFPGSKVYELSQRLFMLKKDVENMLNGNHVRGWITNFNIKHNFASPQMIEQGLQDLSMLLFEYRKLSTDASNALREIYDENTVHEWIELNLEGTAKKLNELFQARRELLKQNVWPRRPFLKHKEREL